MAILAALNLVLVFFDLSYVSLRDVYVQTVPSLVQRYDPVKGIAPHPFTQYYLEQVNVLMAIAPAGITSDIVSPQLAELRRLSQQMVTDNPFQGAEKSEVLTKIERSISDRVGVLSGREGLDRFWSADYLAAAGWRQELDFFNRELRPLILANYYRDVTLYGRYVDRFWILDLPFILIFALDYLGRTFYISRRRPDLTWVEALLRRWYDLALLLPFWRWLRVLPVAIRLYQADLLNLNPLRVQLSHDFAVNFAGELIEMVGIQVIDQMQTTVKRGDVARWLLNPESRGTYVQVNNTNEVKAIANRLVNISVYDVLPRVRPDVEALVHHSLSGTLEQVPVYRQLKQVPGLQHLPTQLTEKLAKDLSHAVYGGLVNALEDPVGAEITARLQKNFQAALTDELQKNHNLKQFETWLVDLLEEIKINYVENVAKDDMARVVEETEQLHRRVHR